MASESSSSSNTPYPIKTVVVLVQENRSFVHIMGWMKSLNLEINGVSPNQFSNPISTSNSNSNQLYFGDKSVYVVSNPSRSIQDIYEQKFSEPWTEQTAAQNLPPKMNGFAQNAERNQSGMSEAVMNGFLPDKVAVFKELVQEFVLCDKWFAFIPASTQPNR